MGARASMERSVGKWPFLCAGLSLSAMALCQGTLETNRPTFKDDEIGMAYEFVWGGRQAFGNLMPVRVEIENPLNDDAGVVTVTTGSYKMHYPVELPSRSLRSFIVYVPTSESYVESLIELTCRQVYLKAVVDPPETGGPNVFDVALISDSPSLITFLRTVVDEPAGDTQMDYYERTSYRDFACLPGKAPDRAVGYQGLDMLILSEGAERLTDGEVSAIQRYVLSGGTLLFTGGAVSPILRDERWAAFVPGTQPRVTNVAGSRVLGSLTGVPLRSEMTLTAITPAPGTTGLREDGVPLLWYRKCGLGLVVYWAFDPFQSPMRTYAGRTKLFTDTITNVGRDPEAFKNDIGVVLNTYRDDYYYGAYSMYSDDEADSVFRVSMPPTSTVFLILACYFVVVVPVNFLLLNRLGKGQLAWVTSPAIGLAFAAVFFYVASDLYSAGLSRSTKALVVAHEGSPMAYATANQQLFFPNGGRYDLRLEGVEAVSTSSDYREYYGAARRDTGFSGDMVDVGEVVAQRAGVSNLAFREIHVEQALPWAYRFPLTLALERQGAQIRVRGALTNDSQHDLFGVKLWIGHDQLVLGDLKAGETRDINELLTPSGVQERGYEQPPMGKGQVAITASAPGITVASPLGSEQGGGTWLFYSYSTVGGEVQG